MKEYKPSKPMTIVYDYLFNYFGEDKFNEKIITGAAIELAINVYDNNDNEIKFTSEPVIITEYGKKYLCEVYDVSIDRKKLFIINKNLYIDNIFRIVFG